jgi:AraC family transcriptional regulator of arabinose operon
MVQISETLEQSPVKPIDLELCFYGKEDCLAGHFWGPGVRDQFIIHYIHSGKGIFIVGDNTYHLSTGQGFLIYPDTIVYYKADEADPWTYSWLGFQGLHANAYLERANMSVSSPFFDSMGNRRFDVFFGHLFETSRLERSRDVQYQSLLYRFFAELIESTARPMPLLKPSTSKEVYIKKAIDYIEINFSQKISVMDIARTVGLDRTYLSSLFKDKLSVSLQTFLLHFRIKRACELMHNIELSIGDISRSVGYTDPFLFSKMFKKINKVSPRKYREQQFRMRLPE